MLQRQHLRKSQREPVPPTTMGSVRRQEMQKHELDCYSDCGYPTRPRPKVILSVPRPGSAWSAHHASKLQTVPVRVGQQQNGTIRQRTHRASIGSPFQVARYIISSRKTNTEEKVRQQRRSIGTDIESSGGVSESEESCLSTVGCNHKSPVCGRSRNKVSVAPLEPPALTRVKKEPLGLSLSWPGPREERNGCTTRDTTAPKSDEMSSNHSRAQARRTAAAESGKEMAQHPSSSGSSHSKSGKKSRKPTRALTFSFGSSSDRMRRGLGYLHSKVTRKLSEDQSLQKLPETHLAVPSSPILQSKEKSRTLPAISRSSEFQRHCILEERDSESSQEDWGPDLASPCHDRLKNKHTPPPPPLTFDQSSSLPPELISNGTGSPHYSPNSGLSSRQESMESLTQLSSSPPSRQESPSLLAMPKSSKRERRKLSDPDLSDRDSTLSNGGETPKGSQLKKRYTFCVRPTKQSPRPGWVNMYTVVI